MITRPTVFVVGAGGSRPYGFPLGSELLGRVVGKTDRLTERELGDVPKETYAAFVKSLQRSGYSSVDRFLERNPDYTEVGKLAIAAALLPCERDERLFPPLSPRRDHWYETLANMLNFGERRYLRNKVTIITFNYDRSFEYYLGNLTMNRLPKRAATWWRHHEHVPIIHLHGKLGGLGLHDGCISYDTLMPNAKDLKLAAQQISVIHAVNPKTRAFIEARSALRAAERIYFLGFGYNETNVARLQVFNEKWSDRRANKCIVRGTSLGMSSREWDHTCTATFHGNMSPYPRYRMSITEFLRNAVDLD